MVRSSEIERIKGNSQEGKEKEGKERKGGMGRK